MENHVEDVHKIDLPLETDPDATIHDVSKPGSAVDDEIIVFNIGGVIFETLRETIQLDRTSVLSNEEFLRRHYRAKAGGYFFDRDPDIFRAILNYLRTGELHLPSYVCGPAAKKELSFWGVPPSKIERCCWTNYNDWNATLEALKQFEKDSKTSYLKFENKVTEEVGPISCWEKWRPIVWRFLTRSNSSAGAKAMGLISLFFVFISIFTFIAETTTPFQHYIFYPNSSYQPANTSSNDPNINGSSESKNATTDDDKYKFVKIESKHPAVFITDMVCLAFFTIEYITRLVCAPRKLKFVLTILALVDLLAIIPDYVELLVYTINPELQKDVTAVSYISILRVARVLRIFRLIRHVPGLWILVYTIRASISELMLLVWFLVLGILVFSSLIYFVDDQEEFTDIPQGFWWALITMTTVGYGDMYPTKPLGKVVGCFCAISGVLMIGFTVPALVNNFMLYYRHVQFAVQLEHQSDEDKKEQEDKVKTQTEQNITVCVNNIPVEIQSEKLANEKEPFMVDTHF